MHLFTDYVQPLTFWLNANPHWALLITFVTAFAESLAIVGSIVPGSVTMTTIGILAGSGVMDFGLTFIASALGAIAGDSASYAVGFTFSERLTDIWPFSRYPRLINYGKHYFEKHGGKSVIIGRFFGPLRSIIPIIAGILRMNRWHFLLANIISGIGWAILYLIPGVLIGAASTELSAESATRLFIFILLLLASVWLVSQGVKWLFLHTSHFLHLQLRKLVIWSKRHPQFTSFFRTLTPKHERNHYPTAGLILLFLLCFLMSVAIILLVVQGTWIADIDLPCHLFLQSMRTQYFDAFFIIISLIISPLSLLIFGLAIALCTLYYRDKRMLLYWASLTITCMVITCLLSFLITIPKPAALLHNRVTPTFPVFNLVIATAWFGFLTAYTNARYRTITVFILRIILASLLFLGGFALIYLGDNWGSSIIASYFIGLTICLAHWIYFRKQKIQHLDSARSVLPIILSCSLLLASTSITYPLRFEKIAREHAPYLQQFVLTHQAWWNQSKSLLPVYSRDRIGNRVGLLNIQYLGSLNKLEEALINDGWKKQPSSLFYSLLMRASGQNSAQELPLIAQLYLNRKPNLILTYSSEQGQIQYILRLWRSNYHLRNYSHPIWLGSVTQIQTLDQFQDKTKLDSFKHILPALSDFKLHMIALPYSKRIETLPNTTQSKLLMIKELITPL